jgi:hypothetical protein
LPHLIRASGDTVWRSKSICYALAGLGIQPIRQVTLIRAVSHEKFAVISSAPGTTTRSLSDPIMPGPIWSLHTIFLSEPVSARQEMGSPENRALNEMSENALWRARA